MKNVKAFKIFETPDRVFNQKLRHKKKDSKMINKAIGFLSTDAITFSYDSNGDMVVSNKGKHMTHDQMGTGRGKNSGRLWFERKIITFWDYPTTYKELKEILKDIQEAYNRDGRRKKIDFFDGKWQIETGYSVEPELDDFENDVKFQQAYDYWNYNKSILIPISDYKEGDGWTPEQKSKAHVANWKEREKLKKKGIIEHPKGFGSEYRSKEVQKSDSIGSPGKKMTMAQYNNIKKKYIGENYIMKFETYNTHVIANPDEVKANVAVDYVDLDYFGTEVERDEKEPPNPTGRDDREVKNKTKKTVAKISVS
ncbi:MAG: hypothetical protein M0R46_17570 [Candidatus Muirbacterium halophilum]|nr:hypothetical protein [Candidatus Muirbacterium halophilum]